MADTDRNFFSVADVDGKVMDSLRFDPADEGGDPATYDDILKFSHARNVIASRLWIAGGSENGVDMNRECRNIRIEDSTVVSGHQCAIVIKGGCREITLDHIRISGGRMETPYDIELGGWSDQTMKRTTGVRLLDVVRFDGRHVRVVVGHADRPAITGGRVKVLFWRSVALKLFWYFRRVIALATGINRKPKTV